MLKQPQYQPVPVEKEIVIIFCGTAGYLDEVPRESIAEFERDLYRYMDSVGKKVAERLLKEKKWTPEIEKDVRAMIEEFKKSHPYGEQKPPPAPAGAEPSKETAKTSKEPAKPAAKAKA
jgi:F-type H+-transporting ATPase subunit alpha